jgi:hypothetical protein
MLDQFKKSITDAQQLISELEDSELKIETYKLVLSKLIDIRLGLITELPKAASQTQRVENSALVNEPPVISPTNSTQGNIRLIFATNWGETRRSAAEVRAALDANGVPDPKHTSTALTRLVEAKELLRIRQNDEFVYWRNPTTTE